MIVLSNSTEQTLQPGQSLIFDVVRHRSGCGECHRPESASVKLKANGMYDISFNANIASEATGVVQLSIQLGNETLPETTMISTPAAANQFNNVSASTEVKNCCCDYDRLTVVNTGTTAVIVNAQTTSFKISRRA